MTLPTVRSSPECGTVEQRPLSPATGKIALQGGSMHRRTCIWAQVSEPNRHVAGYELDKADKASCATRPMKPPHESSRIFGCQSLLGNAAPLGHGKGGRRLPSSLDTPCPQRGPFCLSSWSDARLFFCSNIFSSSSTLALEMP